MRDWSKYWQDQALLNATMSTCRTRQVGAVAYRDKRQIAAGFNGNISGELHCNDGGCVRCNDPDVKSGEKLDSCFCIHAEMNLVAYCAKYGVPLSGASVTITTAPCVNCIKLLASSGVVLVEYIEPYSVEFEFPEIKSMIVRQVV